jgi:hypothetical protein
VWMVGSLDPNTKVFTPSTRGVVDQGSLLAAQSFTDDIGRRILYGWIPVSGGTVFQGAQSLPREIVQTDQGLAFAPASEVSLLHVNQSEPSVPCAQKTIYQGTDMVGGDYANYALSASQGPADCQALCCADPDNCKAWVFVTSQPETGANSPCVEGSRCCWLKNVVGATDANPICTLSIVANPPPPGHEHFSNVPVNNGTYVLTVADSHLHLRASVNLLGQPISAGAPSPGAHGRVRNVLADLPANSAGLYILSNVLGNEGTTISFAAAEATCASPFYDGMDTDGDGVAPPINCSTPAMRHPEYCRSVCCATAGCNGFTYSHPQPGSVDDHLCWLKGGHVDIFPTSVCNCTSGLVSATSLATVTVSTLPSGGQTFVTNITATQGTVDFEVFVDGTIAEVCVGLCVMCV